MTSKREEERNEKIIRGLMKLPPNRRCINCNSLVPQYVCTNFWTFVCVTCSGIHREFTHRVKSVSMAKFASQEVEALQKGGNQRARETYLKDWDPQRQRLPDSSNVNKVREFIKSVYVDRKYAGEKTSDRPPNDTQNLRIHEDETRRASSYHSYSQSPPYDFQYEERRYGIHTPALTRKPGSDRGLYEGKVSSFLSPSRSSDHAYEDRFTNEGSNSRASNYFVSSGGDPFRSYTQSPNFHRDIGFNSPSSETSKDFFSEDSHQHAVSTFSDTNSRRDADRVLCPQRTASLGSFGSFDSNSMSVKSVNSLSLVNVASEPNQSVRTQLNRMSTFPSLPRSSISGNSDGQDTSSFVQHTISSTASDIDLFQLSETSFTPSVDLFQPPSISAVSTLNSHRESQISPSSPLDFFSEIPQQQSAASLNQSSPDGIKNEGWATFDMPQHTAPSLGIENSTPATIPSSDGGSLRNSDTFSPLDASIPWPGFQDPSDHGPSLSMPNVCPSSLAAGNTQSWNAFDDFMDHPPLQSIQQIHKQDDVHNLPPYFYQHLGLQGSEDLNKDGFQKTAYDTGHPILSGPSHVSGSSYASSVLPAGTHSLFNDHKSTNPFDLPYDSDLESSNTFLDMSSLQAAMPNGQLPTSFIGSVTQPLFRQNSAPPYIPAEPQGALGFMSGKASSTQTLNVQTQGPVGSIGGNPFA